MRMAICFYGLPRLQYPDAITRWQEIIKFYNAGVFAHTWLDNDPAAYSSICSAFSPKAMILEPQVDFQKSDDDYPERIWPNKVQNVFSQWYSLKKSISLVEHGSYDLVMKARYDVVAGWLDLDCQRCILVPADALHMRYTCSLFNFHDVYGINDLMAAGPPDLMAKYAELYDNIDDLYFNHNIKLCSELLLGAHLLRNKILVAHRLGYSYIDGRV